MKLSIRNRFILTSAVTSSALILLLGILHYRTSKKDLEKEFGTTLEHVVQTATLMIDGDKHLKIQKNSDAQKSEFKEIKKVLERVIEANDLTTETLYTFNISNKTHLKFAVMTHRKPFVGNLYSPPKENIKIFQKVMRKKTAHTKIYKDENGTWVSGLAPILTKNKKVAGIIEADLKIDKFLDKLNRKLIYIIFSSFIILIAGLFFSAIMSNKILSPINQLIKAAQEIQKGNFTHRVRIHSGDEFEGLGDAFNLMSKRIFQITEYIQNEVNENADQVHLKADQVKRISTALSKSASLEAAEIEEGTAALNLIHENLQSIARNIRQQEKQTETAVQKAQRLIIDFDLLQKELSVANESSQNANKLTKITNKQVGSTLKYMDSIRKKSDVLIELIELLNSISEKLQMLSLNASIEASKNGERGSGFRVVANEITELSDKTNHSTAMAIDQLNSLNETVSNGAAALKESNSTYEQIVAEVHGLTEKLKAIMAQSKGYKVSTQVIIESLHTLEEVAQKSVLRANDAADSEREVLENLTRVARNAENNASQSQQVKETSEYLTEYAIKLKKSVEISNLQ